jgi:type II secretory pathway predicted ATPase ExeA
MDTTQAIALSRNEASGLPSLPSALLSGVVGTPGARWAIERLGRALATGQRHVRLLGPSGVGKSLLLEQFLRALRRPSIRVACASGRLGEAALLEHLVRSLRGSAVEPRAAEPHWQELGQTLRLAAFQALSLVIAVDDAGALGDPEILARLLALCASSSRATTVIEVVQSPLSEEPQEGSLTYLDDPAFPIVLRPLTRTEAASYLREKHITPSVPARSFSDAAVTAMHALAQGLPRRLDRLAAACLELAERQQRLSVDVDLVNDACQLLAA